MGDASERDLDVGSHKQGFPFTRNSKYDTTSDTEYCTQNMKRIAIHLEVGHRADTLS